MKVCTGIYPLDALTGNGLGRKPIKNKVLTHNLRFDILYFESAIDQLAAEGILLHRL